MWADFQQPSTIILVNCPSRIGDLNLTVLPSMALQTLSESENENTEYLNSFVTLESFYTTLIHNVKTLLFDSLIAKLSM